MAKKKYYQGFKGANIGFNVTDNSGAILEATDEQIEKALIECGIKVQEYATKNTTTDTGRLKASITFSTSVETRQSSEKVKNKHKDGRPNKDNQAKKKDGTPKGEAEKHTLYVGTNVEYAPYVEMGTSKTDPKPFLEPAFVNQIDLFQQIFDDNFKKLDGN